jgi:hypothetical protein
VRTFEIPLYEALRQHRKMLRHCGYIRAHRLGNVDGRARHRAGLPVEEMFA